MTEAPHHRRYLVDTKFQFKYTGFVILCSSIVFAVLGWKLYQLNLTNTQILEIQQPDVARLVQGQDTQILYLLGGFFVLQVVSLFVLGILLTHRIAGPLFRASKVLEEITKTGELMTLSKVRERDEFQAFFDNLGDVLSAVKAKTGEQRKKIADLQHALEAARTNPDEIARCVSLCAELKAMM